MLKCFLSIAYMGFLTTIQKTFLDLFYPDNCVACGKPDTLFCPTCLADLPAAERESDKWIYSIFDYRYKPLKRSLWLLKYKNKRGFVELYGEILHERIIETLSDLVLLENFKKAIVI